MIHPGPPVWTDTTGQTIQAHGAGLIFAQDNMWYMYGESLKTGNLADHGINAYVFSDLSNWKFLGMVLKKFRYC